MSDITIAGATFSDVTKIQIPKSGSGTAEFVEVSGSQEITQNNTYDVSALAQVVVNVSGGGGGGGYTLVWSGEVEANTTSTSPVYLSTTFENEAAWNKNKIIYCRIRDKAGKRDGYFYGTDCFVVNNNASTGSTTTLESFYVATYKCNNGTVQCTTVTNTKYGVCLRNISQYGIGKFQARYNSSYTGTINGTYKVDVYLLDWPVDGVSPFTV